MKIKKIISVILSTVITFAFICSSTTVASTESNISNSKTALEKRDVFINNSNAVNKFTSNEEVKEQKVKYVSLNSSGRHNAMLMEDGSLYMCGGNYSGQLGNGTTTDSLVPVKIMDNVKYVDVDGFCSAAITEDGSLYTWGNYFELDNGTTEGSLVPVKIMDNVKYVKLDGSSVAAITEDGSLYTWGYNFVGKLGNGTTEGSSVPVKIMDNVKSISISLSSCAAITEDGSLYTWGANFSGQLGNGTTEDSLVPVKIMDNVKTVDICSVHSTGSGLPIDYGNYYNAAITEDGQLYTWGNNNCGQLGNGTTEDSLIPIKIMDNVKSVDFHENISSAITEDGQLYTWGRNDSPRVIYDNTTECNLVPIKIMDNVKSASVGCFSAAVTEDDILYTWGSNGDGQFDNGIIEENSVPVKIMNNAEKIWAVNDVPTDESFVCIAVITKDGSLYTWGCNYYGQLGNGTTEFISYLTKILPFTNSTTTTTTTINSTTNPTTTTTVDKSFDLVYEKETVHLSKIYHTDFYPKVIPSDIYLPKLAYTMAILSASAYDLEQIKQNHISLGFNEEDCSYYNYEHESFDDCAYSIATKEISEDNSLILITIRGTSTPLEWLSNINIFYSQTVGTGEHTGFGSVKKKIINDLKKEFNGSIPTSGVTYMITGHSRGAGVGNILAKYLYDEGVPRNCIYDYNFACPDVARDKSSNWNTDAKYDFIYNVNIAGDPVPVVPGVMGYVIDGTPSLKKYTWGKYGVSRWFSLNWNNEKSQLHPSNHDVTNYVNTMKKEIAFDKSKTWLQLQETEIFNNSLLGYIFCPVDVEIYNSDKLIASIHGEEIFISDSESFSTIVWTEGDHKFFVLNNNSELNIKLVGTDTGTMDCGIVFYNEDKNITMLQSCFEDVEIFDGKIMMLNINNDGSQQAESLNVLDENNEITEVIRPTIYIPSTLYGDINRDKAIDAADASLILQEYALVSTGHDFTFTDDQKIAADVNNDGAIDAVDASLTLSYYAYLSTSTGDIMTFKDFLADFKAV